MDAEVQNLAMASRITQMMTQQLMQNMKGMHDDISRALGIINELQYKILAIQKASGLDLNKLNDLANEQRLKDFNEASDKEDIAAKFTVGTVVDESSTVILTSETLTGAGIFRSRIKLAECGVPDLIKAFMGREVGVKAIVKLNEVDHEVELLGIRQPAPVDNQDAVAEQNASAAALTEAASPEVVGNA
jgi:hypothetical protein